MTHGDRHVALQVKLSRIYAPRHGIPKLAHIRGRRGWWTFNPRKLRESRADLIALATHGRTGLARLALGSVAEDVLRRSTVPVLCFPTSKS